MIHSTNKNRLPYFYSLEIQLVKLCFLVLFILFSPGGYSQADKNLQSSAINCIRNEKQWNGLHNIIWNLRFKCKPTVRQPSLENQRKTILMFAYGSESSVTLNFNRKVSTRGNPFRQRKWQIVWCLCCCIYNWVSPFNSLLRFSFDIWVYNTNAVQFNRFKKTYIISERYQLLLEGLHSTSSFFKLKQSYHNKLHL